MKIFYILCNLKSLITVFFSKSKILGIVDYSGIRILINRICRLFRRNPFPPPSPPLPQGRGYTEFWGISMGKGLHWFPRGRGYTNFWGIRRGKGLHWGRGYTKFWGISRGKGLHWFPWGGGYTKFWGIQKGRGLHWFPCGGDYTKFWDNYNEEKFFNKCFNYYIQLNF